MPEQTPVPSTDVDGHTDRRLEQYRVHVEGPGM